MAARRSVSASWSSEPLALGPSSRLSRHAPAPRFWHAEIRPRRLNVPLKPAGEGVPSIASSRLTNPTPTASRSSRSVIAGTGGSDRARSSRQIPARQAPLSGICNELVERLPSILAPPTSRSTYSPACQLLCINVPIQFEGADCPSLTIKRADSSAQPDRITSLLSGSVSRLVSFSNS